MRIIPWETLLEEKGASERWSLLKQELWQIQAIAIPLKRKYIHCG